MDWASILGYTINDIEAREEVTDSVYTFMTRNDVNENSEIRSNPAKLLKLIQIAQVVLKIKGAEAEAAFEELTNQSGGIKRRTSSERDLRDKIAHLEQDLKHRELTVKDLRREVEENRSRWKRLESENERLEQRVDQYREQMELQRQSYSSQQDQSSDYRQILRKKDKEMNAVLDQIEEVEKEKNHLEAQLQQVTEHCDTLSQHYEEANNNVQKLQELLKENDYDRHQLKGRNQILEQQVTELQQLTAHKSDTDDQILSLVNAKSVEWERLLANKDVELIECHKQIQQLQQQLTAANMDTDKASVIKLSHALREKEQQVKLLHGELQEATSEITQLCNKVEELKLQSDADYQNNSVAQELNKLQQEQAKLQKVLEEEKESKALVDEQLLGRDKELAELYQKVRLYETGQYGLSEAVAEIKQKKVEIAQRDEQIVKLTQLVGEVDIQLNTALEENEVLKQRLGMTSDESVDVSELRHKKNVELDQLKNINRDLSQEVHRLEEEKLELRKQLFKLGTPTKKAGEASQPVDSVISKQQSHQQQIKQLHSLLEKTRADLAVEKNAVALSNKEAAKLRVLLKERQQEVDNLNDYHEKFSTTGRLSVTSNTPDETDSAHLRNEVARLNIENSELRTKLEQDKQDLLSSNVALEQSKLKVEQLHSELHLLSERESHLKLYQPVSLPQDLSPNTQDTVAGLTEHLMQCLQELTNSKKTIEQLTAALEKYKTKFAIIISQQGILYREYNDAKQSWENDKNKLLQQKTEAEEAIHQLEAKSTHLLSVQEALSADPDVNKQKLSEFSRKITALRVNERSLSRKLAILQASESALKKENGKLKQDIVQLENSVTERLGYLQRYKETAAYKISSLQNKMASSVPLEELDKANKYQEEMTMKYAQLLHHQETNIITSHTINQLQAKVKQLQRQLEVTKQELMAEKKSVITQRFLGTDQLHLGQGDDHITSQKIATLEMKELNERQRADLATTQLHHCQILTAKLQERNKELESKIVELTTCNMEGQNREQQLRMQLVNSVSHETKASLDRRISDLEHSEAALKLEVSRLKDAVEMAKGQSALMTLEEKLRSNEISSLQQQLFGHQVKSDDKATIGKLHRQLTALQASETIALQQLEQANAKVKSLEASLLALEKSCDDKDQIIVSCRHEAADKVKHLQSTIQELHRQFSGSVPLSLQEKYSTMILKLQEDKITAEQQLAEVRRHKEEADQKAEELQLQLTHLQDLLSRLKDNKATAVTAWDTKVGGVQMKELERERMITKLQEEVKLLNETIRQQEIAKSQENSFSKVMDGEAVTKDIKMVNKLKVELLESHQKMLKVDDALKDAHSQLLEKDKELTQLRMMLDTRSGLSTVPNDNLITSQQLKLAQDTIKNLKDLVEQKQKAADKYQSLLETAREEMHSLNKAHKEEIKKLMQQIHSHSDNTFSKLKQAALDAVNTPSPKLPTEQQLTRLQELEELLKEQEASVVALTEKLETTKVTLQAENRALSLKHDKEMKKLQSLHDRTLAEKNFMLQQKDTKILELEQELEVVEGELSAAREQAPSRTMKNLVEKLRTQLQVKEKQHKALNQALKQVRADLVEATQNAIKGHIKEHENDQTVQDIVDKQTAELKTQVNTINAEVQRYKERNSNYEHNLSKLTTELSDLKQVLLQKESQIKTLQTTLEATQSQVEMLESRKKEIEKQNEELQQQLRSDTIIELQKRCQLLQEEVNRHEQQKQEVINSNGVSTNEKSTEKVLQWEESKKWQKKVDVLRTKLADSNKENETLQKQIKSLKDIMERSDREKSYLHKKLQSMQKYPPTHSKTPTTDNNEVNTNMHQTEQLKRKIHQLEEEVARLKHDDVTGNKSELSVLKATKQQQQEYIQSLEAQLSSRDSSKQLTAVNSQLHKLQQQLWDREKENVQLQFQYEQAVVDLPRLQNRIKDLEHYNEILKATKQQDNERDRVAKTSSQAAIQRVSELEKVISAMKKVMEKLQEENESYKKSATSKRNMEGSKEKKMDHLEPSSPLKQFEKVSKENDKLRKDLKKEADNSEHLQLKISRLQVENNRLQDEMQKVVSLF